MKRSLFIGVLAALVLIVAAGGLSAVPAIAAGGQAQGYASPQQGSGYGPGWQGYGYGMGPGTMYRGGGMGPGMMGPGYGYGYGYGPQYQQPQKPLEKSDAETILKNYLASTRNPNLKLGKIEDKGTAFQADILTASNSLVDKILVDKNTGWVHSAY
jgi:hypothetical protein